MFFAVAQVANCNRKKNKTKNRPVSKHQDLEGGCLLFQVPWQSPGVGRRGSQNILPLAPERALGV